MKLFLFLQGKEVSDQIGVDDGFRRLLGAGALSAYQPLPYYGSAEQVGWPETWNRALHQIKEMRADVVFLQYFHGPIPDPTPFIGQVRELPWRPSVITSAGDGFGRLTRKAPPSLRTASRLSDLTFLTQMGGVARDLVRSGARRVVLMPNGYCQVRFDTDLDPDTYRPEFDVVMIGNGWRHRNPIHFMFYAKLQRLRQAAELFKRHRGGFGLFGAGWEGLRAARGPVPYAQQIETIRRARIVVGAVPQATLDYYTSDRAQIAMRSGIPYVEFHVPRTERLFLDGEHWHLVHGIGEMLARCDALLALDDAERLVLGARAAAHMVAGHSQFHRVRSMVDIIRQTREADLSGRGAPLPRLDFFAPGVELEEEWPHAVLGWGS